MTEKEYILTYILNCSRADLYAGNFAQKDNLDSELSQILARRKNGEPVQYITGRVEFMGLEFKVDRGALIPRPETEILAEEAIKIAQGSRRKAKNIMDIGTGSGNIVISLAKNLPNCKFSAVDISVDAIQVAKENAVLNNVEDRIEFIVSDLFSGIETNNQFDLIVSNPPYIVSTELDSLPPEVKCEPRLALDGGRDGLDFYRRIIKEITAYLRKGGVLLMEIGFNQASPIREILEASENLQILQIIKDYSNIERVIILERV